MMADLLLHKANLRAIDLHGFNELGFCRNGPVLYNKHDIYMGGSYRRYGEFCRYESEQLLALIGPDDMVIEVGSNMGGHTVELAKKARGVYAFEPQRLAFQLLNANLALQSIINVWAYQQAVGAEHGEIMVPFCTPTVINNTGAVTLDGSLNVAYCERVPLVRLDDLVTPYDGTPVNPSLIKIDVEGMESEVLSGAIRTIKRCRPFLYVENDRREKSEFLIRQIASMEYRLHWHLPALYHPQNFFGNNEEAWPGCVSVNMLCVPMEREFTTDLPEVKGPLDRLF